MNNPYIHNTNAPPYPSAPNADTAAATSAADSFFPGVVYNLFGVSTNQCSGEHALPVFPPCGDDDKDGDDKPSHHQNMIDRETAPRAAANINPTVTLHSIYDYGIIYETFLIDVPDRARDIICTCILTTIACIASPRPFQIFAIFCMVFLKDQFIYLIRKTGKEKS